MNRDRVTGRFAVDTSNSRESHEGKFPTRTELDITNTSADDVRPGFERPRHGPESDDLAPGGPWPVHRRLPVLTPEEDDAFTTYGNRQGLLTRDAARRQGGPYDPTAWLTGADDGLNPGTRARVRPDVLGHVRQLPEGQEGADDGNA
jgi:hypothetical protein